MKLQQVSITSKNIEAGVRGQKNKKKKGCETSLPFLLRKPKVQSEIEGYNVKIRERLLVVESQLLSLEKERQALLRILWNCCSPSSANDPFPLTMVGGMTRTFHPSLDFFNNPELGSKTYSPSSDSAVRKTESSEHKKLDNDEFGEKDCTSILPKNIINLEKASSKHFCENGITRNDNEQLRARSNPPAPIPIFWNNFIPQIHSNENLINTDFLPKVKSYKDDNGKFQDYVEPYGERSKVNFNLLLHILKRLTDSEDFSVVLFENSLFCDIPLKFKSSLRSRRIFKRKNSTVSKTLSLSFDLPGMNRLKLSLRDRIGCKRLNSPMMIADNKTLHLHNHENSKIAPNLSPPILHFSNSYNCKHVKDYAPSHRIPSNISLEFDNYSKSVPATTTSSVKKRILLDASDKSQLRTMKLICWDKLELCTLRKWMQHFGLKCSTASVSKNEMVAELKNISDYLLSESLIDR